MRHRTERRRVADLSDEDGGREESKRGDDGIFSWRSPFALKELGENLESQPAKEQGRDENARCGTLEQRRWGDEVSHSIERRERNGRHVGGSACTSEVKGLISSSPVTGPKCEAAVGSTQKSTEVGVKGDMEASIGLAESLSRTTTTC